MCDLGSAAVFSPDSAYTSIQPVLDLDVLFRFQPVGQFVAANAFFRSFGKDLLRAFPDLVLELAK